MPRLSALPSVESLDARRLLDAIPGTAGDDVIRIMRFGTVSARDYAVEVNGVVVVQGSLPLSNPFAFIDVDALGGNDLIETDPLLEGRVRIAAGDGADTIVGGHFGDTLLGTGGADLIFGKNGPDTIVGGAGADTIRGGNGADSVSGDADLGNFLDTTQRHGNDLIFAEAGLDHVRGGNGNDTMRGGADADTLIGGDGDDYMLGEAGDDEVWLARNQFNGIPDGRGSDFCDGGAGTDRLNVNSVLPIRVTLDGLANDGTGGETANITATFEKVSSESLAVGSLIDLSASPAGVEIAFLGFGPAGDGDGFVTLVGSEFDDVISGGGFGTTSLVPHHIDGRGGDDSIQGGQASDSLLGGAGDDMISAGLGNDMVFGGAGNDSIAGFYGNDAILGEDGNDTIEGGDGDDRIAGMGGNDLLYGDDPILGDFTGRDTIEGGVGHDSINGGPGGDRLFGNGGRDTVNGGYGNDQLFGGPTDADRILGGVGTDTAAQDEKDTYDGVEELLPVT